jgi:hypothetical protein
MSYDFKEFLIDAKKLVEVTKSLNNFNWNLIEVTNTNNNVLVSYFKAEQP